MTGQPDSLVFDYLRRFDVKLDRVIDELSDIKIQMTHVEEGLAGVHRRLDRIEIRLDRVEKRVDLADAPN